MARKQAADNTAYQKLKTDIKAGQLDTCYLLHGERGVSARTLFWADAQKTAGRPRRKNLITTALPGKHWTGMK